MTPNSAKISQIISPISCRIEKRQVLLCSVEKTKVININRYGRAYKVIWIFKIVKKLYFVDPNILVSNKTKI